MPILPDMQPWQLSGEAVTLGVQVLKEFYAVATGKLKKPLAREESASLIRDLCHACHMVDDTLPQLDRAVELAEAHGL
jgi:predicted nucleic acid-binding protein